MPIPPSLSRALAATGARVEADAPMHRRTTWRTGGAADLLVTASTLEQLAAVQRAAREAGLPVVPVGAGSNLLVADAGVRGIVVQLDGALADTAANGDALVAGAGLRLVVLLARAAREGWPGLEALAGIPGTVGGAVRMNAGTSLGEVADRLVDVDVVHPDGRVETLPAADLGLRYRHSVLPPGAIVARARLRLEGDAAESSARAAGFLATRKASQPLDLPSCGSTFTNPPGDAAGRLIDAAGLKGATVGGAQVSQKHANFLVNTGGASSSDIAALVRHVQDVVEARSGVRLVPEFQAIGAWDPEA
jgi:UDP-N-acetylmuramate dehydrogenase